MAIVTASPLERAVRFLRRAVWRLRKLLDPSLETAPRNYFDRQMMLLQRLDGARSQLVSLKKLIGPRYLLRFPVPLTNNERSTFLTLQEAEVVTPRICRQVIRDAFVDETNTRPVLVGPWTTEIGFELLYWVPFIRYFAARREASPSRLIAISRGGVSGWYEGVCDRYVELFDLIGVDEFVHGTTAQEAEAGGKKGFGVVPTRFEMDIYARAAKELGLDNYSVLSPSAMYTMFRNIWRGRYSGDRLHKHLDIQPMQHAYPRPDLPFDGDYVAVKFYNSECFSEGEETRDFVRQLLERLAARTNVVLLNTGAKLDDHDDVLMQGLPNVVDASRLYTPSDNLGVQTALVAHSKSLFCTYGGFSYLGPLLGVPTSSYFTRPTFVGTHLDLAMRMLPHGGLLGVQPVATARADLAVR